MSLYNKGYIITSFAQELIASLVAGLTTIGLSKTDHITISSQAGVVKLPSYLKNI